MNIFDTESEQQDEYLGTGGDITITTSSHQSLIFFKLLPSWVMILETFMEFFKILAFLRPQLQLQMARDCVLLTFFYLLEQLGCHTG